jgi:hypothetical protein
MSRHSAAGLWTDDASMLQPQCSWHQHDDQDPPQKLKGFIVVCRKASRKLIQERST